MRDTQRMQRHRMQRHRMQRHRMQRHGRKPAPAPVPAGVALVVDAVLGVAALAAVFGFAALALGAGVRPEGIAAMVLAVAAAAGRLVQRVVDRGAAGPATPSGPGFAGPAGGNAAGSATSSGSGPAGQSGGDAAESEVGSPAATRDPVP
jgi:hypothetical protein